MAFTRKALAALGLNDELVEKVMTLHGTSMADFIPKSELKARIDEAVAEAQKNAPAPNIMESDEYKNLRGEFDKFKRKVDVSRDLRKGGVKEKFIDNVFDMMNDDSPAEEQLAAIREQYEEFFEQPEEKQKPRPQFSTEVKGRMPLGEKAKGFTELWGYGRNGGN